MCDDEQLMMSNQPITITLKLFAAYEEAYGQSEINLQFPPNSPVKRVLDRVIKEHPSLEQWRETTRFGINLDFVSPDTLLQEGDEVVLIPPVSGG